MFIRKPYQKCPKCENLTYGVLSIYDESYIRRCIKCKHTSDYFYLPKLNKKVIYIDQNTLSNMMFALNDKTKSHQRINQNDTWLNLFKKLDKLCKMQLIVCPNSSFHKNESLVSPHYEPLNKLYELLGNGISFLSGQSIKISQIKQYAENWINNNFDIDNLIKIDEVFDSNINAWQEHLIISIQYSYTQAQINEIREKRNEISTLLEEEFKKWQNQKNKTFDDYYIEEAEAWGKIILQLNYKFIKKILLAQALKIQLEPEDYDYQCYNYIINVVDNIFENHGILKDELIKKRNEFFTSPHLINVPFINISALLYAALARKAAAGQKRPPSCGMYNDIEMISTLLPYCDAMLIDNECRSLLNESPLNKKIKFKTKLFSKSNINEFFKYLDETEKSINIDHIKYLIEVYSFEHFEPYTTIYKN